jgi:S1-C subfamily serine protease
MQHPGKFLIGRSRRPLSLAPGPHGVLAAGLALALLLPLARLRAEEPPAGPPDGEVHTASEAAREAIRVRAFENRVRESDDWTFRPTVLIRRGNSQGSGTIIASLDNETLILTAAHVVRGKGPIKIELHRYNLGREHVRSMPGTWPRVVLAESVFSDTTADLAVLRVRKLIALPYVARLGPSDVEPPRNSSVTSLGIDLGTHLSGWETRLVEVLWFELNDSGTERPFLVTDRVPEHGRSGGGLFDGNGNLVGVCVGHAELVKGKRMGIFSSIESVRQLLEEQKLTWIVDRSERKHPRSPLGGRYSTFTAARPPRSAVTPTQAMDRERAPSP